MTTEIAEKLEYILSGKGYGTFNEENYY